MNDFYNDVNEWLSVGADLDIAAALTGQPYSVTIQQLQDHGVTHVLDVRIEWHDQQAWAAAGLPASHYCHAPITDHHNYRPPREWFATVQDFVRRFLAERSDGDRLYVHCHMGINRAPSAAMLALLTADPTLDVWEAFLTIRTARNVAGLVYADSVAAFHIAETEADPLAVASSVEAFADAVEDYWSDDLYSDVRRGIAYFRDAEGATIKVGGTSVLGCPADVEHTVKWNGGNPICLDCGTPAARLVTA